MTIAEKMAEEQSIRLSCIVDAAGGEVNAIYLRKGLTDLITEAAERGRKEACKFLTTEEYETIDAILADKWEEEEA